MKKILLSFLCPLVLLGCGTDKTHSTVPASASSTVEETTANPHEILPASLSFYHKAAQEYGKGNHTEALQLADKALDNDKENYQALSLKGIILSFAFSPEEGIPYIEKALSIAPGYTQAFYDMAIAQKLGGHPDISNTYFEKVLQADSQNIWSYYGMATNWADKKNKEQALLYLEKAVALGGKPVKDAAGKQDHFLWLRNDPDFQKILHKK